MKSVTEITLVELAPFSLRINKKQIAENNELFMSFDNPQIKNFELAALSKNLIFFMGRGD